MKTHYETLGVERDATLEQVRAGQLRRLSQIAAMAGRGAPAEKLERLRQAVAHAYRTLENEAARAEYDLTLDRVSRVEEPAPEAATTRIVPADRTRLHKVEAAARAWVQQLVDLTGNNRLLYYKDLPKGTLDIGPGSGADKVGVDRLLASGAARLSNIFSDPQVMSAAARRSRVFAAKARENHEERGLGTMYLAWGMATWDNPPNKARAAPAAPVLLRKASLHARGGAAENFDLALPGEWEINPTLLQLLASEFNVRLSAEDLLDLVGPEGAVEPNGLEAFARLENEAASVQGFSVAGRVILGNFSYAKLPMVADIEAAVESGLLEEHDLLAAIAGDESARAKVRERHPHVEPDGPDHVPPADEFLVLDADASQSYTINAVTAGADLVIEGPPGTGKSQTIANLIATLAARHKRVLFVAEKRAAIDAVVDRLDRAGLGDLVLDLHDGGGSRRKLSQDLAKAMAKHANQAIPDVTSIHDSLVRRRTSLVQQTRALHEIREPWGVSVFEIHDRLLGIPGHVSSPLRIKGDDLAALDAAAYREAVDELRSFVDLGGLPLLRGVGPWAQALETGAISSAERAREALESATRVVQATLPSTSERLSALLVECGLRAPATLDGWNEVLTLLDDLTEVLTHLDGRCFGLELNNLVVQLEPLAGGWFGRAKSTLSDGRFRKDRKLARSFWKQGKPAPRTMHRALVSARSVQVFWGRLAAESGAPRVPNDLSGVVSAYAQLGHELRAIGAMIGSPELHGEAEAHITRTLESLLDDQLTLYKLPKLCSLKSGFARRRILHLVLEAASRNLDRDEPLELFDHVWLSSILETVSLGDPIIGAFDGAAHSRDVADFQSADRGHIATAPERVRRAVAEWAVKTRDEHPNESDVVEHQARLKSRHLPVRGLFERAPNVLCAMKPCWAMSPLVVAQLLPLQKCFDVVIFDEASQVTPADAVGALLRADRAIVAGDPKQLPPTRFFASSVEDDDDSEEIEDSGPPSLTKGMESVLDVMGALLPPPKGTRSLGWHYRSKDERLIAFSNAQENLYSWSLTTFPGIETEDSIRHVPIAFRPGRAGQENSVSDEVEEVVSLILEHGKSRPEQSLGVIAMGIKHANRISESLRQARASRPDLDSWFESGPPDKQGREPFFVKNLERVQGDERDAVILTIGYGKNADGRMLYRFGPLNEKGGERRLNVAITRARSRMTVVSSFSSTDMDPTKLSAEGAKMLRGYLAYAESGGSDLGQSALDKPTLNPFELNIRDALTEIGIPLVPQWGCSGYWIDFAAQHPTKRGQMVLAIECDGASYHSSATARDRDRLRQEHLERLGWSLHRIWSTEWFRHREQEVTRARNAYDDAVQAFDLGHRYIVPLTHSVAVEPATDSSLSRGPRPINIYPGQPIDTYTHRDLVKLIRWIKSDTLLRTEDDLLDEAVQELGYQRRGPKIKTALTAAIRSAKS